MNIESILEAVKLEMRIMLPAMPSAIRDLAGEAIENVRVSPVNENTVEVSTYDDHPGIQLLIDQGDSISEDVRYIAATLLYGYGGYIKHYVLPLTK